MDVPDITSVNLKTSYLEMKDILEETRKTVQESHLVDSNTARIVDNPGGTRSIVVVGNDVSQTEREVLVVNPTTGLVAGVATETPYSVSWPNGTACAIDIGYQEDYVLFAGYYVSGGSIYIRWANIASDFSTQYLTGNDVTITAFL